MIGTYNKVNTDKDHFVIWSGGCDSTLMLYEIASKYGTKDRPIKTISFDNQFLDENKTSTEQDQRTKILEELKSRGLHIQNSIVKMSDEGDSYYPRQQGLPQAFLWIAQSMIYVGDANVHFGYIRGDDFWHHKESFVRAFNAIGELLGHDPNLVLPLEYSSKADVIKELHNVDLYDLTWYCELPTSKGEQCFNCVPCTTHLTALFTLGYEKNDWAKDLLSDYLDKRTKKEESSEDITDLTKEEVVVKDRGESIQPEFLPAEVR